MNKKITSSVLAAVMIAGTTSFSAFAAMANGTVVIGNKAFDLSYANNPVNAAEITNAVVAANGAIFVKDFEGNWINNATGLKVLASVIPAVTYKSATGVVTMFDAKDMDQNAGVVSVKAIDTAKVEVKFAGAVDPAKVTVALKQGLAIQYTTAVFAADNKSVVLTAPTAITAGTYSVVVSGIGTADITTPISIVAATPTAVAVTNTQATIGTGSVVSFSVTNQYATDMAVMGNDTNLTIAAYDVTANIPVNVTSTSASKSEVSIDLSNAAVKVGDDVRIIISYKGLTVTKTIKVVAVATVSDITLGNVLPLATKTRITAGETGLELPYTLKNQFGVDVKLTDGTIANNPAITFVSSNNAVVNPTSFVITSGKLTFTAATAGSATITAIINATGKVTSTALSVSSVAALKTVVIASPTTLLSQDQTASLKLSGLDQYGVATTNFSSVAHITSTNGNIAGTITNGVLNITASTAGTATLTLTDNASTPNVFGTVTVKFEAAAIPTAIIGLATPATFEVGAVQNISLADIMVKDQYGRDFELTALSAVTISKANSTDPNAVTWANGTDGESFDFTASATAGTEAVKFTLANLASYTASYKVVPTSSVVSYAVVGAKTIFANVGSTPKAENYKLALAVEGKLADGTKVVLVGGKITNATSSNEAVATVTTAGLVTGLSKGTTTVALWNGATKLAETTLTVDTAAPVATTVAIDDSTAFTVAVSGTVNVGAKLSVKDQYGVKAISPVGFWASSDATVATVNSSGVVTGVKLGQVTITYVTSNGIVKTTSVTVQ